MAYGITGGIPLYMSKLDDKRLIEDNIKDKDNFFDASSYLFEEPSGFTKGCRELADTLGNVMLINYEDMKWNRID